MTMIGRSRLDDLEAAYFRTERKLEETREKIVQVDDRIDRGLNAVINLNDKYHEFTARFNGLEQRMDQRFTTMDQRFATMDDRFKSMDLRFNGIDERLNTMEQRTDQRFDAVDRRFDGVDARLQRIETVMVAMAGKLGVAA